MEKEREGVEREGGERDRRDGEREDGERERKGRGGGEVERARVGRDETDTDSQRVCLLFPYPCSLVFYLCAGNVCPSSSKTVTQPSRAPAWSLFVPFPP